LRAPEVHFENWPANDFMEALSSRDDGKRSSAIARAATAAKNAPLGAFLALLGADESDTDNPLFCAFNTFT